MSKRELQATDREEVETGNLAEYSYIVAGMGILLDLGGDEIQAHITPSGHLLLPHAMLPLDIQEVIDEVLARKTTQFGLLNLKTGLDVVGDVSRLAFTMPLS
jgi:hypothetical protein